MLEEGHVVAERYLLAEPLGEGGMGSVWRARDEKRGIDVAIKFLRADIGSRETTLALFKQEAEVSARMLSRHIVRVLDRGLDDQDVPFIVFELLDGEELGRCLDRDGCLPLDEGAAVVVQGCRALERAHAVGVVHRDIKPENIFLCRREGLVKVLDFGIASHNSRRAVKEPAGRLSGTFEYMSPELVLEEKKAAARDDLYALGVVAYRAFTGRVPYPASNVGSLVLAFSQGPPPVPSTLRAELSPALDPWFETAMHRVPERRFQTAREMADAFSRAFAAAYGKRPASPSTPESAPSLPWGASGEVPVVSPTTYSIIQPSTRKRRK